MANDFIVSRSRAYVPNLNIKPLYYNYLPINLTGVSSIENFYLFNRTEKSSVLIIPAQSLL